MRGPLPDFPWDILAPFAVRAAEHPDGSIDLSIGSPVDPTPDVVARALAATVDAHTYPPTAGSADLRAAISDWYARRREVSVAPVATLPTIGSKELIALLPFILGLGEGDVVVHPEAAYPTYAMSAALSGATAVAEDDPERWPAETKLIWVNSPGNPNGHVRDVAYLRRAVARARELGAVIAGDECYAELGWDGEWETGTTPCILHPDVVGDNHAGVLSVYSLSKQSNLAGYRAAFLAGDESLVRELLEVRKHAGLMVAEPVQAAMIAALRDDEHVQRQKQLYRERREILRPAVEGAGFTVHHSEAGLYLWVTRGNDCWNDVAYFAERGIVVAPGEFYGASSTNFVRLSLTAPTERMREVARRLAR